VDPNLGRIPGIPDVLLEVGKRARIPRPPRPTIYPQGPKGLGLQKKPVVYNTITPEMFPGVEFASYDELLPYWAFTKILGPEGLNWYYQKSEMGGRHLPGGSVLDFSIEDREPKIAVRVQTERFHVGVNSEKRAYDYEQMLFLSQSGFVVHDIFSHQYLHDETGQTCLRLCWAILNGFVQPNPALTGALSVRPA
jgi:hypothetical protein